MQEHKKSTMALLAISSAAGVFVGAALMVAVINVYNPSLLNNSNKDLAISQNQDIIQMEQESHVSDTQEDLVVTTVEKVQPAVVSIIVSKDLPKYSNSMGLDPFFEQFFSDPFFNNWMPHTQNQNQPQEMEKRHIGGGSGFLASADGLIVTNKHVVEDEEAEYTVITYDGQKYDARVLARDPLMDLAYLKIEGQDFKYLNFADSDQIKLGQTVIAIGNALDEFRNSVTKGIVSGLNRRLTAGSETGSEVIESAIQTDAAINPGNSGGPLVNIKGEVVGVNTAMSMQGQLIGFALPSNLVKRGVEQVSANGKISRPYLGVRYQMITKELIDKNKLKVDHGALIIRGQEITDLPVMPGSPADKAGLKENDIILQIDGKDINEEHSLAGVIAEHAPGDEIEIKISRAGEEQTIKVVLEDLE